MASEKLTQDEANAGQVDTPWSLHAELVVHLTVDVPQAGVWLAQRVTVVPPHHTAALFLQGLAYLNTTCWISAFYDSYSREGVCSICLFQPPALGMSQIILYITHAER